MEHKIRKGKITSKIGKVGHAVKHFVKGAGKLETVNFELQWPLKVL